MRRFSPNLNFNFVRDVVPIASIRRVSFVMVVNLAVPAREIPEFIAYAKANPHKIKWHLPVSGPPRALREHLVTAEKLLHQKVGRA